MLNLYTFKPQFISKSVGMVHVEKHKYYYTNQSRIRKLSAFRPVGPNSTQFKAWTPLCNFLPPQTTLLNFTPPLLITAYFLIRKHTTNNVGIILISSLLTWIHGPSVGNHNFRLWFDFDTQFYTDRKWARFEKMLV